MPRDLGRGPGALYGAAVDRRSRIRLRERGCSGGHHATFRPCPDPEEVIGRLGRVAQIPTRNGRNSLKSNEIP